MFSFILVCLVQVVEWSCHIQSLRECSHYFCHNGVPSVYHPTECWRWAGTEKHPEHADIRTGLWITMKRSPSKSANISCIELSLHSSCRWLTELWEIHRCRQVLCSLRSQICCCPGKSGQLGKRLPLFKDCCQISGRVWVACAQLT